MTSKYPDADTSKERLEEIKRNLPGIHEEDGPRYTAKRRKIMQAKGFSDNGVAFYDLLAMIEERDAFIAKVLADEKRRMNIGPIEGGCEEDV